MLVAFFGILAMALIMMAQPMTEQPGAEDWHDQAVVDDMAQHFIVYKNIVVNHVSDNPGMSNGDIPDSTVSAPSDWQFPGFHHRARKDGNGWSYVWSEVPGAFYYETYKYSGFSVSVCRVIASRQCVRSDSSTATLPPSLVPSYIATGSTVYAWRP